MNGFNQFKCIQASSNQVNSINSINSRNHHFSQFKTILRDTLLDQPSRNHSEQCRKRLEEAMQRDPIDKSRVEVANDRIASWLARNGPDSERSRPDEEPSSEPSSRREKFISSSEYGCRNPVGSRRSQPYMLSESRA